MEVSAGILTWNTRCQFSSSSKHIQCHCLSKKKGSILFSLFFFSLFFMDWGRLKVISLNPQSPHRIRFFGCGCVIQTIPFCNGEDLGYPSLLLSVPSNLPLNHNPQVLPPIWNLALNPGWPQPSNFTLNHFRKASGQMHGGFLSAKKPSSALPSWIRFPAPPLLSPTSHD